MSHEFRNPRYASADHSTIDVEIRTGENTWDQWTASGNDPDPAGRDTFDAIVAAGGIADYVAPPPAVPASVSARQFKVQLVVAAVKDQVDAWVAQQTPEVQMAYEYSWSFLRTEPMMQSGFQALGFTDAQIDAFFTDAAAL